MSKKEVFNLDGSKNEEINIPKVFLTPYRPEVIRRVYNSLITHEKQPQGVDPLAGKRTSATSWGVGRGAARMARVKGERHPRAGMAAGVASVVKGRQAHPPKAEKKIYRKINQKERHLAIASAVAATAIPEIVAKRGHRIEKITSFPLIVSDDIEVVDKASDLKLILEKLGLFDDINRASMSWKRRSGTARMRGRTTKSSKGPLFVVSAEKGLNRAVKNFLGAECVLAKKISLTELAPGSHPGRLTIWTKSSFDHLPKRILNIGEKNESN